MKLRIFALFFSLGVLSGNAKADDRLYFHIECSQGQNCMDLAYGNGKTESVLVTPAQVLGKSDIKSASVEIDRSVPQGVNIELSEEASKKFEKITGENIGKRLMVVFDNKILTAPTIHAPIADRRIMISKGSSGQDLFWQKAPWLQDLVKDSNRAGGRSAMIYVAVAAAILISALVFVVLPRRRKTQHSSPE
jgi:hypothetical protein